MAKKKYIATPEKMWCNIEGNEGYMISNHGDVISFRKRNSKELYATPTVLKQAISTTHCGKQYSRVTMNSKSHLVHRLVAFHFIDNHCNKPQVNHKDGDGLNNVVTNLEWATNSENQIHRFKMNGTTNKLGQYIQKDKNRFRVYKKGVVDKGFAQLEQAIEFAKQYY